MLCGNKAITVTMHARAALNEADHSRRGGCGTATFLAGTQVTWIRLGSPVTPQALVTVT